MISDILTWFISIWLANSILTGTLVSIEMAANGGSEYSSSIKIAVGVGVGVGVFFVTGRHKWVLYDSVAEGGVTVSVRKL